MDISRDVDEGRRVDELRAIKVKFRKSTSVPTLKGIKDGEGILLTGSGKLYVRDGNKIWEFTGTEL